MEMRETDGVARAIFRAIGTPVRLPGSTGELRELEESLDANPLTLDLSGVSRFDTAGRLAGWSAWHWPNAPRAAN